MTERVYNVLFLCTGNSARSILAEGLLNHWGQGRFHAFSAGSFPTGRVNPRALRLVEQLGEPLEEPRSKSWNEFAAEGAPRIDFIVTVCDAAAGESCPVWPGHPMTAHWGVPDPAAVQGNDAEKDQAFEDAFQTLQARIRLFIKLPIDRLDRAALQEQLQQIGRHPGGQRT